MYLALNYVRTSLGNGAQSIEAHFQVSRTMNYKYMGKKNEIATEAFTTINFLIEYTSAFNLFFKF